MSIAAFWIASGDRYILEANASAWSFAQHMPEIPRILITDSKVFPKIFSAVNPYMDTSDDPWYLRSTRAFNMAIHELPYEHLIYMETDTYVCEPFWDVIDVLSRFDFAGTHAPGRHTAPTVKPIPEAFPEINIGVLAFNVNKDTQRLFDDWLMLYEDNVDIYGNNDQAPLREALWNNGIRFYILPPEYNFKFRLGGFARYNVKVLHGRPEYSTIEEIAAKVNTNTRIRAWNMGDLI